VPEHSVLHGKPIYRSKEEIVESAFYKQVTIWEWRSDNY
jgi:hypothetical protein